MAEPAVRSGLQGNSTFNISQRDSGRTSMKSILIGSSEMEERNIQVKRSSESMSSVSDTEIQRRMCYRERYESQGIMTTKAPEERPIRILRWAQE